MNCCQARRELELMQRENNGALLRHLHRCGACREYAEELRLVNLLRTLPAPAPSESFEERVLNAALPKRRNPEQTGVRKWQLATAASLLLAVFFALPQWRGDSSQPPAESIASAAGGQSTLPLSVALETPHALENAMISVSLPESLALDGYGDQRELRWRTNLNAGANRLTLPVRARTGQRTEILIRIEHDGARKEFYVPVDISSGAGMSEDLRVIPEPQTI